MRRPRAERWLGNCSPYSNGQRASWLCGNPPFICTLTNRDRMSEIRTPDADSGAEVLSYYSCSFVVMTCELSARGSVFIRFGFPIVDFDFRGGIVTWSQSTFEDLPTSVFVWRGKSKQSMTENMAQAWIRLADKEPHLRALLDTKNSELP